MTVQEASNSESRRPVVGVLLFVLLFLVGLGIVSMVGEYDPGRVGIALTVLMLESGLAIVWLVAAMGWGFPLCRLLGVGDSGGDGGGREWFVTQVSMGIAVQLLITWMAAWLGWLTFMTAWAVVAIGVLGLVVQVGMCRRRIGAWRPSWVIPWPVLLAGPVIGMLAAASMLAPGAVWSSEFGGYDVLEYHLQVPREYMQHGSMIELPHNAYAYMPNLFEVAFLHLGYLYGSVHQAAYGCQLLHAMIACIAAVAIGRITVRLIGDDSPISLRTEIGTAVAAIYLAVPWTQVTGSMAYNEQVVVMFAASALLRVLGIGEEGNSRRSMVGAGVAIGLVSGTAVLCKLSSVGFVVVPIATVIIFRWWHGRKSDSPSVTHPILLLGLFGLTAVLVVMPFAVRNYNWTGNPLFPLLTDWLGTGPWDQTQADRWQAAHQPELSISTRVSRLWGHVLMHEQFAYVIWPLAMIGLVIGCREDRVRGPLMGCALFGLVQLAFWLAMTHLQSRFIIPMLIPACVLIGFGLSVVATSRTVVVMRVIAVIAIVWSTFVSVNLYHVQRGGMAGIFLDGMDVYVRNAEPFATINQAPQGVRIYAEGFATPFYVLPPIDYHTVWDRSPLGQAIQDGGGGVEAGMAWLKSNGYTHVLIDWAMLKLWHQPDNYGYDRSITFDRLADLIELGLQPITPRDQPYQVLYEVK